MLLEVQRIGLVIHGEEALWTLCGMAFFLLVIIAIVVYRLDQWVRQKEKDKSE